MKCFDDGKGVMMIPNSLLFSYLPWLNMDSYISNICSMYGHLHHFLYKDLLCVIVIFSHFGKSVILCG